ncbi:MAG: radical SAM protein [Pseudomonadota bacterium]
MTDTESGFLGEHREESRRNDGDKAALVTPFLRHLPFHPSCFLGYGAAILRRMCDLDVIDLNAEIHCRHGEDLTTALRVMDETEVVWDTMHLHPLYGETEDRIDGYYAEIPWNTYHAVYITAPSWFPTVPTEAVLRLGRAIRRRSPETRVLFFGTSPGSWTSEWELQRHGVQVVHLNSLFSMEAKANPIRYDDLPIPLYEHKENYLFDLVPFVLKHGCRWAQCRFCSLCKGWNSGYLERSPRIAAEEFELLVERYAPGFLVCRDNALNGDNLMDFCRNIESVNKPWCGMSRADLSGKQIEALRRAGCRMIFFGLESGSDRTLRAMNKGITSKQMSAFIKTMDANGMLPAPSLVIGTPGEGKEDFDETVRFVADHRRYFDVVNVYPFMPTPYAEFGTQNEMPSSETPIRLIHFTMKCEDLGLRVCVGEQCAEYVLFETMCRDNPDAS